MHISVSPCGGGDHAQKDEVGEVLLLVGGNGTNIYTFNLFRKFKYNRDE